MVERFIIYSGFGKCVYMLRMMGTDFFFVRGSRCNMDKLE